MTSYRSTGDLVSALRWRERRRSSRRRPRRGSDLSEPRRRHARRKLRGVRGLPWTLPGAL